MVESRAYGAVGATAQAPKSKTGLDGAEVFDCVNSIRRAENGGFIVSAGYTKRRTGSKKGESYPEYCPPKEFAFDTFDQMVAELKNLFGAA